MIAYRKKGVHFDVKRKPLSPVIFFNMLFSLPDISLWQRLWTDEDGR
jgi:hypothetical protein